MLADDDFDVDAEVAGAAENFDDASDGRSAAARITGELDIDYGAVEFGENGQAFRAARRVDSAGKPSFSRNAGVSSSPGGISISCWMRMS